MAPIENKDQIKPSDYQLKLPIEELILSEKPSEESVPMDVLFVGAGPAGLAGAIELSRLVKKDNEQGGSLGDVQIGVLEKAKGLGEHCLSGAVINPVALQELFPELKIEDFPLRTKVQSDRVFLLSEKSACRIPAPPPMHNKGNYVASLCEVVRWMGGKAEEMGVNIFTGFPADALLVEDKRVVGVRTTPAGLNPQGQPSGNYQPPTDITAKATILTEGTRGTLTQAYLHWEKISAQNPQIYALGVKEVWETKVKLESVVHTLGWPLPKDAFGGSFLYPMADNMVAFGLVVGLDYKQASLDVHGLLQQLKQHPLFQKYLKGGELLEWGAKTIPEGGYYSIPERLTGDGLVMAGDAVGFVNVPALKGIHYAMKSGILAARAVFQALKKGDTTGAGLSSYDESIKKSYIHQDLYKTRNMRLAFKSGFYAGGIKASMMTLTGGALPGGKISVLEDAEEEKIYSATNEDAGIGLKKVDAVYHSGNTTRDDIPSHLSAQDNVPSQVAEFYTHVCPAGVYENQNGKLVINAPNCIDCKATDVLGPRWRPREGGSGPSYQKM